MTKFLESCYEYANVVVTFLVRRDTHYLKVTRLCPKDTLDPFDWSDKVRDKGTDILPLLLLSTKGPITLLILLILNIS